MAQFLQATGRCREVQAEVRQRLIARHAASRFGRQHGLAGVRTLEDFRRQLPVAGYEYFAPYIEEVKQGRLDAMFAAGTEVLMFALTSGTTGEAKYIPITREFLADYRRGWNLWGTQAYTDHPGVRQKFNVQLASEWRQFNTPAGIPCGNISGLAMDTATLFTRGLFIVPQVVRQIRDPMAKLYAALRAAVACRRVGLVLTANPSTLVSLSQMARDAGEELIRDIRNGTLSQRFEIPSTVRTALEPRFRRPDAARARELGEIVERTGRLTPRDFWPGLALLGVWTGGSAGAYVPRLREYFGDVPIRDHGLSASEGRMTVPFRDATSAGVLDLTTHYFEFIPEAEHDKPHPTVLEAHELERGASYYILLTTSSGLYRYDIHDVVRCVDFVHETPVLEFLNKGSHFSSVTGEKLSEFQVVAAARHGFAQLGLTPEPFTVAPVWTDPPRYVLLIEPGPHTGREAELAAEIDERLIELNREYADRRATGRLLPLVLRSVPVGTWQAYRGKRIARVGGSLEQYKQPCLVGDLGFAESLALADAR